MFELLKSYPDSKGGLEARLEDDEMGLKYVIHFLPRRYVYERQLQSHVQVLSRVFAIPQKNMKGYDPNTWLACLRFRCVLAEQHLPVPRKTV